MENVIECNADVVDVDVNLNASLSDEDEVVFVNLLDLTIEALVEVGITNEREDPLGEEALEDTGNGEDNNQNQIPEGVKVDVAALVFPDRDDGEPARLSEENSDEGDALDEHHNEVNSDDEEDEDEDDEESTNLLEEEASDDGADESPNEDSFVDEEDEDEDGGESIKISEEESLDEADESPNEESAVDEKDKDESDGESTILSEKEASDEADESSDEESSADEEDENLTNKQRRLLVDYSDEPDEQLLVHKPGFRIDPRDNLRLNPTVGKSEAKLRTSLFIRPAHPALEVFKWRETQYPPGIFLNLLIMTQIYIFKI